ncbi:MAG: hypothetical protein LUC89_05450 [Oscillospiraceae bacterium]|nr:hypothetical protein [Oscillospiraceae bacterium]
MPTSDESALTIYFQNTDFIGTFCDGDLGFWETIGGTEYAQGGTVTVGAVTFIVDSSVFGQAPAPWTGKTICTVSSRRSWTVCRSPGSATARIT